MVSQLCIRIYPYYLSALIFLRGHASKTAPPTIFPKVTITMLLIIAPTESPGTRQAAVTKIPIFATQCSNPLTTNPEIHITIIRNLPASLFNFIPQSTPRQTKKLQSTARKNIQSFDIDKACRPPTLAPGSKAFAMVPDKSPEYGGHTASPYSTPVLP